MLAAGMLTAGMLAVGGARLRDAPARLEARVPLESAAALRRQAPQDEQA
jgi:hypothetical protein